MKQVWKNSLVARSGTALVETLETSSVFQWLVGAGKFHELFYFRHSLVLRLLRLMGKVIFFPAFLLGKQVRKLVEQSGAQKTIFTVIQDYQLRPIGLLAIASIAMLVTNTLTRYAIGAPPSWRGLAIRLMLILLCIPFIKVKTSWQTLLKHSWAYQALRQLMVD